VVVPTKFKGRILREREIEFSKSFKENERFSNFPERMKNLTKKSVAG